MNVAKTDGRTPEEVLLDRAFEMLLRLIERYLEAEEKKNEAQ